MEEKQNISLEQDLARYRQYYQENIAPRLRVKQYYGHSLPAGLVSILFLGLLIALWLFFPSFDKDTIVERIIGAFLCWLGCDGGIRFAFFRWYRYTRQRWQILRNETGKFFGLIYKEPETIPLDMIETLSAMGMLLPKKEPKYAYWGEQHGLSTDIFYIRTGRKEENCSKKNDPEIYLFMLVHRLRTPLQGETILLYNSLSCKWGGKKAGLHRIKLEWLAFEEQFDLFSDSEKEARLIMQPDVMQAVYDFCRAYPDLKISFVFKKEHMAVLVEDYDTEEDLPPHRFQAAAEKFFRKIWFLLHISVQLEGKALAAPWQEKDYLRQRRSQETAASAPDIAQALPALEQRAGDPQPDPGQALALNTPNAAGVTPVMEAVLAGDVDLFKTYLHSPGIDVNQRFSGNGNTLLHLAALNGRTEMVRLLLACPDLDAAALNAEGHSALDIALQRGQTETAQLLSSGRGSL